MRFFLLFLVLSGCAVPLTEAEELQREYEEQERREMFLNWRKWCNDSGYVMHINRPISCHSVNIDRCIPHRSEWHYRVRTDKYGNEHIQVISSTYVCTKRAL